MPASDHPNSPTELASGPIATDNLDEAGRAFEAEALYEMEAAVEQDRERTILCDGVL
jgi:hypothetical protein